MSIKQDEVINALTKTIEHSLKVSGTFDLDTVDDLRLQSVYLDGPNRSSLLLAAHHSPTDDDPANRVWYRIVIEKAS